MLQSDETPMAPEGLVTRAYGQVTGGLSALGTIWIFVLMLLICADVAGLALFSQPLYGVVEVVEQTIVPVVFLQLAHALAHGRLTRADFLFAPLAKADPAAAAVLNMLFLLIGGVLFGALTWVLWGDYASAFRGGEFIGASGVFTLPTWPFKLLTAIGCAAATIQFLLEATDVARQLPEMLTRGRGRWLVPALIGVAVVIGAVWLVATGDFSRTTLGILAILFLLVLLMAGMHVAVVLGVVGVVGIWLIRDNPNVALNSLKTSATGTINKFDFGVVPLFVLMGLFTDISDIGRDAYRVAAWWTRKLLGGLGIATVAANAVFAAITGISIASSAIFSRVAVPQMVAHGYTPRFATGTVAGSSILGMLIPPSLLLIIFGFVTETSVGKLFLAAMVPGILMALIFCITIILLAKFRPDFVGQPTGNDDLEPETLASSARRLLPIVVLVGIVLGGIYLGWFTPTQAGAVGAFATMIVTILRRRLTRANLWNVLRETGQITVAVLSLVIGASVLTKALVMSTLPAQMVQYAVDSGFGFWGVIVLFLLVVIVMGMFLDSTSIIVITVPMVVPLVTTLGTGIIGPDVLIWFGIVTIIAVEMGLLTPPFGISVFVVKSTVGDLCSLQDIFAGVMPYVLAMAALIGICMAFPAVVTGIL
ncbi:TRAP transporter large permease subunit [Paracoccus sp. 11-3]|uniref:TRAP transporter large permease subunit n=1 Tax=Paracoccus amoyensis TaxID=2760093 RepID=A0A926GI81_9RHOB|nr:TRAP transporter large permease subunit [Paracoccus amoyensis]MBC9247452.1 TRAP transporter large permease subunit [Paracoccus amoyensis]